MGFLRFWIQGGTECSGSRARTPGADLPVKMRSEWMSASNSPRKMEKIMQPWRKSSEKCGQNACQPQIPLVKWTKSRNFCEKPGVFSAKVGQIMDFLAWGRHRQPGGAKWRRLGADLPVKMRVKSMSPSNSPRKVDKLMLLCRKYSSFSV